MKSLFVSAGALVLSALLASCGGGGGSPEDHAAAGAWLTFSPNAIDLTVLPDTETRITVTARATKTLPIVNVAIIDSKGVITTDVNVAIRSASEYVATLRTNHFLAAGTYTGNLEVRLCYDADPRVCSRPVEGSPWQVPYKIKVLAASALSFSDWEVVDSVDPKFSDNFALSYRAGKPVVVTGDRRTGQMETLISSDSGATWSAAVSRPSPIVTGFALASDGDTVYLSGGLELINGDRSTQYRSDVWAFDGSTWQQKTAAAPFAGREDHVMAKVGNTLFVAGGGVGYDAVRDIWKSIDNGVTWTRVAANLPAAFGKVTCAMNWKNSLLLVGDQVATSPDGINWTAQTVYPSYFPKGSTQCAAFNGKLVISPSGLSPNEKNPVSSTDLINWQPEPAIRPAAFDDRAPGMAVIDGRLMITTGLGGRYPRSYRTVP